MGWPTQGVVLNPFVVLWLPLRSKHSKVSRFTNLRSDPQTPSSPRRRQAPEILEKWEKREPKNRINLDAHFFPSCSPSKDLFPKEMNFKSKWNKKCTSESFSLFPLPSPPWMTSRPPAFEQSEMPWTHLMFILTPEIGNLFFFSFLWLLRLSLGGKEKNPNLVLNSILLRLPC